MSLIVRCPGVLCLDSDVVNIPDSQRLLTVSIRLKLTVDCPHELDRGEINLERTAPHRYVGFKGLSPGVRACQDLSNLALITNKIED